MDNGMPASPDAERSILGGIILDNSLHAEVSMALDPEDFNVKSHQVIFQRMCDLAAYDNPIDSVTLMEVLVQHKELGLAGGAAAIAQLTDGVPKRSSLAHYIQMVKDKSRLRHLIRISQEAQTKAMVGEDDTDDLIGDITMRVGQLVRLQQDPKTVHQIADEMIARIMTIRNGGKTEALPTSLSKLDTLMGIRPSDYIILAARTSHGKSSMLRQISRAVAQRFKDDGSKKYVVNFTYEMTRESYIQCSIATEARVDFENVMEPEFMTSSELDRIAEASVVYGGLPIQIDDEVMELTQLVARMKWHIANGAGLIGLDYMQMVPCKKYKERYDRVTEISAQLRDLAKISGVPLIALCQLSRPEKGRENVEPSLYDLKESGNIENDAVKVGLIYRPKVRDEETERWVWSGEDWFIVPKNRFGPQGHIPLRYNGPHLVFEPREVAHKQPTPPASIPPAPPQQYSFTGESDEQD